MGTNYYLDKKKCPTCGHRERDIHIGKSSAGWCFSLHVYLDGTGPSNLDEWKLAFEDADNEITDEYGRPVTAGKMLSIITDRFHPGRQDGFDYERNHAEPGPNGLVREKLGGGCIGHGDGTYDLIVGDFS